MGLGGLREGLGRDCDRSASEPTARCVPAVPRTRPTGPEESDSLLWTQSGGLSPPPVLGDGAARTTARRCACSPLPPPASLTHPQPATALCARLSHTLLRAAQVAMIALLRAREHPEHPLAQLELLCIFICGSVGQSARAPAPLRVACDRVGCACHRSGASSATILRMPSPMCKCMLQ